ncbi:hypothetical protein [Undibacterium umbellatum]|uniref:Uncharacterized protein n=1 Tax=Undibacterium umbellatum TaxID=2762300 RepID=A0ABR6ZAE4_9BURK|nr:hypothetical protein [Undibacterium umbellatum]MBC3908162.1 hypothetical protein [Undibacterium umbellatum]
MRAYTVMNSSITHIAAIILTTMQENGTVVMYASSAPDSGIGKMIH